LLSPPLIAAAYRIARTRRALAPITPPAPPEHA